MIRSRLHVAFISAVSLMLSSAPAWAQVAAPRTPSRQATVVQRAQPTRTVTEAADAQETRGQLEEVLRRYSPNLGAVLKLDPTFEFALGDHCFLCHSDPEVHSGDTLFIAGQEISTSQSRIVTGM